MDLNLRQRTEYDLNRARLLVAGCAGLVGSSLTEKLSQLGVGVVGIDNLSHPHARVNLRRIHNLPNFDFIEHDLTKDLPSSLRRKKFTHILHVTSTEDLPGQPQMGLEELLNNSLGLKSLLDLSLQHRAIFTLTSTVYVYQGVASRFGLVDYYDHLVSEQDFSFLEGKRFAESLCQQYFKNYGLDIRIARLAEVYGPGMDLEKGTVLSELLRQALEQKDLAVEDEASHSHLLLYMSDAVYALIKLMFSQKDDIKGGIYSFAHHEYVSSLSIAYTLREYLKNQVEVEFIKRPLAGIQFAPPKIDLSRAKQDLFWVPRIDLTEGVRLTMDYFRKRQAQPKSRPRIEEPQAHERLKKWKQILPSIALQEMDYAKKKKAEAKKGWLKLKHSLGLTPQTVIKRRLQPHLLRLDKKKIGFGLGTALLFLGGLLLIEMAFVVIGLRQVLSLKDQVFAGRGKDIQQSLSQASLSLSVAQGSHEVNHLTWRVLGQEQRWASLAKLLEGSRLAVQGTRPLAEATPYLQGAATNILKASQGATINDTLVVTASNLESSPSQPETTQVLLRNLEQAQPLLEVAAKDWALARSQLCDAEGLIEPCLRKYRNLLPFSWHAQVDQWLGDFFLVSQTLSALARLIDQAPLLLGLEEPQVTLILLQNNTEMRATGGFIGSYILLSWRDGGLQSIKVDDIYNPDGLLKEKIPAPAPVQKYMQVTELGIRDANWWADFPDSAQKISALFELATQQKVDQVIGLNLGLLEDLLRVIGPVQLEDYEEVIDADNVFVKTESYSEVGFEPGSTQKREFLTELGHKIMLTLMSQDQPDVEGVFRAIFQNIADEEITFYHRDSSVQSVLNEVGWAGAVEDTSGDYLKVVDSNVGGNKANYWIERQTEYHLGIDRAGRVKARTTIEWQHKGTSTSWPGGEYLNYLRVYVPLGSELLAASNFADEVTQSEEYGRTVLAGLVKVPINSKQAVTLEYLLPNFINLKSTPSYQLLVEKQPGFRKVEVFDFALDLPLFLSSDEGEKIQREVDLRQDWTIQLLFSPR